MADQSDSRTLSQNAKPTDAFMALSWRQRLWRRADATDSAASLWHWLKRALDKFSTINGTVWSASFAYYAFFALVPLLLLLVTVTTDVVARAQGENEARAAAFGYIIRNIPLGSEGQKMIATTLKGIMDARGKIGVVALVGLLWSSLGFFQALVSAINQAWDQEPLNRWKLPLQNLKMVGILVSALLIGGILPASLQTFQGYHSFGAVRVTALVGVLGALVPSVVLFYGFLLFYKLAPRRRSQVTFPMVWVPALMVTALLQFCQRLLTLYTTHITNFNAVYGAFGGVMALMLWIYLSGVVIVFGGCLCAAQRIAPVAPTVPETHGGLAAPPG